MENLIRDEPGVWWVVAKPHPQIRDSLMNAAFHAGKVLSEGGIASRIVGVGTDRRLEADEIVRWLAALGFSRSRTKTAPQ
jgi:hypothetical protein